MLFSAGSQEVILLFAFILLILSVSFILILFFRKYVEQKKVISDLRKSLADSQLELNKLQHLSSKSNSSIFAFNKIFGDLKKCDNRTKDLLLLILNQLLEAENKAEDCLEYLSSRNKNLLAVITFDGSIIAYNADLMSLYGYINEDEIIEKNIVDFIQSQNVKTVSDLIDNCFSESDHNKEHYILKTRNKQFVNFISNSFVSLKTTENSRAIIVEIGKPISKEKDSNNLFKQINRDGVWWINNNCITQYISEKTAMLIGYSSDEIRGKTITDFICREDIKKFNELRDNSIDGENRQRILKFVHSDSKLVPLVINTYAMLDGGGRLAGITIIPNEITNSSLLENAIYHRLSMEELISNISSNFVGIKAQRIDCEIVNALNMIEKSLDIEDSLIKLQPTNSNAQKTHLVWSSSNTTKNITENVADSSRKLASSEIYTIPLVSKGVDFGYFQCTQKSRFKEWVSEDIKLIQLVGEIFINALTGKEFQSKLIISEERLKITLNSIEDAVIAVDENEIIQIFNNTAENLIGIDKNDAIGKNVDEILRIHQVLENQDMPNEIEYTILTCSSGSTRYISIKRNSITDIERRYYGEVITFSDITEQKIREDEILYLSYHDRLTNLYNRGFFEEEMRRLDVKRQYPITIIMGDCNGLKITNDVFGHFQGDKLLIKAAEILGKSTRKEDIVARWGGDEFVVLLPKTDEKTANEIRNRILNACINTNMQPVNLSLSLGVATKMDDSKALDETLKEAEERMYRHKLLEGKSTRNEIISSFEKVLNEKNYETEEHAQRMKELAEAFGMSLGLAEDELDNLKLLATLHDIGKIGIPDNILLKEYSLSQDEWLSMQKHPEKGYNIANSMNELRNIANLILHHHEKWDGTGYPDGLKGNKIPKGSRILSIIDAYDVITHSRPYKEPLSHESALEEIMNCAGTQFDPNLARAFVLMMKGGND